MEGDEKETPIDKLDKECTGYFTYFIKECNITGFTDRFTTIFLVRFCMLKIKWAIESFVIAFLTIFSCIMLWKTSYGIEVSTLAKVLSSAGIIAVSKSVIASRKMKKLDDVVKMEVSMFKNYRDQFTIKEDNTDGRGKDQ